MSRWKNTVYRHRSWKEAAIMCGRAHAWLLFFFEHPPWVQSESFTVDEARGQGCFLFSYSVMKRLRKTNIENTSHILLDLWGWCFRDQSFLFSSVCRLRAYSSKSLGMSPFERWMQWRVRHSIREKRSAKHQESEQRESPWLYGVSFVWESSTKSYICRAWTHNVTIKVYLLWRSQDGQFTKLKGWKKSIAQRSPIFWWFLLMFRTH